MILLDEADFGWCRTFRRLSRLSPPCRRRAPNPGNAILPSASFTWLRELPGDITILTVEVPRSPTALCEYAFVRVSFRKRQSLKSLSLR